MDSSNVLEAPGTDSISEMAEAPPPVTASASLSGEA